MPPFLLAMDLTPIGIFWSIGPPKSASFEVLRSVSDPVNLFQQLQDTNSSQKVTQKQALQEPGIPKVFRVNSASWKVILMGFRWLQSMLLRSPREACTIQSNGRQDPARTSATPRQGGFFDPIGPLGGYPDGFPTHQGNRLSVQNAHRGGVSAPVGYDRQSDVIPEVSLGETKLRGSRNWAAPSSATSSRPDKK